MWIMLLKAIAEWGVPLLGKFLEKRRARAAVGYVNSAAHYIDAVSKVVEEYRSAVRDGTITNEEKDRILYRLGGLLDLKKGWFPPGPDG